MFAAVSDKNNFSVSLRKLNPILRILDPVPHLLPLDLFLDLDPQLACGFFPLFVEIRPVKLSTAAFNLKTFIIFF